MQYMTTGEQKLMVDLLEYSENADNTRQFETRYKERFSRVY